MAMPLHRLDKNRHKRLEPFAADPIGRLPNQDQRLTHRFVINPASWARSRSLAWIALPQQALRVLAVHLCYRNELVEDPTLFQTAAPRVSARYGCHKFVPCRHAHLPHIRLCPLTRKRSKSDEATGLYSATFQARQCALGMLSCMKRGLDLLVERSPFKCGLTSFSALATIAASVQSPQRHPKSRSGSARPARRCACGRCGRLG